MMAYHTGRRINSDMAAVNVQNRIAQAQGLLPAEVVQSSGVNVRKSRYSMANGDMFLGTITLLTPHFLSKPNIQERGKTDFKSLYYHYGRNQNRRDKTDRGRIDPRQ